MQAKKFWMVVVSKATWEHTSLENALADAKRLAAHYPWEVVYVLEAVNAFAGAVSISIEPTEEE